MPSTRGVKSDPDQARALYGRQHSILFSPLTERPGYDNVLYRTEKRWCGRHRVWDRCWRKPG